MAGFQECPVQMPGVRPPLISGPARGIGRPAEASSPRRAATPLATAPVAADACCPIPAVDWRPVNQSPSNSPGSSSTSSPQNGPSPAPRVRAGSGPLAPRQNSDGWQNLNVARSGRAQRMTFSGDHPVGSPGGAESGQRRSLSSLCPSALEARAEARNAQQLQNTKHISPSNSQAYPGVPGAAPRERGQQGTPLFPRGAPGSGEMEPQHRMHASLKRNPSDAAPGAYGGAGVPRATSVPSASDAACSNWAEVEALCANMDKAGVVLEEIDIMCLPPLPDEVEEDAVPGMEGLPNASTMMSLKFSSMELKHYPGQKSINQVPGR